MKKLLFVCTGNTCRSPMAEAILRHLLKQRNIKSVLVSSCGLSADIGGEMSENAKKALDTLGIKHTSHKPKQCNIESLIKYNLIITMTAGHKRVLQGTHSQIYTVAELTGLGDVSDPYGLDEESYLQTAKQLYKACEIIIDTII